MVPFRRDETKLMPAFDRWEDSVWIFKAWRIK